jgi:uncharacterized SAM-binding protein YcdF (DUF218 family)
MLPLLKSIPNVSLYFIIWGITAYWFKRKKYKFSNLYLIIGLIALLICTTSYFPKKLIHTIEKAYQPIDLLQLEKTEKYYIHVLGSGTSLDENLPASINLNSTTLTRLFEGIRVFNYLENGILVTSASAGKGNKSQAQVSKEAAISIGVDVKRIKILETPTTTLEEAKAFKKEFGVDKKLIIATSALHMPRAMEIFKDQGLNVIAAPTDYIYKEGVTDYNGFTFPSFRSIELMNVYHRTKLKEWYYGLTKD